MASMLLIVLFLLLISFPMFYMLTRWIFPRRSKKFSRWTATITTLVWLLFLLGMWHFFPW